MMFNSKYGIVVALDESNLQKIGKIVEKTHDLKGVVGYKISGRFSIINGLKPVVSIIRKHTEKPIILDYQKAGTDVPFIEKLFVDRIFSLIDGLIFFPFSGIKTQEALIEECINKKIVPMAGGFMTHDSFVEEEGGYIPMKNIEKMYINSAKLGVKHFIVPGNKPKIMKKIKNMIVKFVEPTFLGPGIGKQGGNISSAIEAVYPHNFYAIVGRSITTARNPIQAVNKILGGIEVKK